MTPMGMALVGIGPGAVPHLLSLNDLRAEFDLRWAITRRPETAQMGPFQGHLQPSSDFQAMLGDPDVQAVIIATPAATHLEIAQACLTHGKHVLLEKPLDVSLARAQAIVDLARQHQRQLGVVLQHRFRPGVERLQALLDQQGLGLRVGHMLALMLQKQVHQTWQFRDELGVARGFGLELVPQLLGANLLEHPLL